MIGKFTTKSRIAAMAALGAVIWGGLAATPADAAKRHGIYQFGGNEYIIRKVKSGDRLYLRLYRLAGDQWEEQGGTSIPLNRHGKPVRGHSQDMVQRIYHQGRYLGSINIDLDNPMNTSLNRGGEGPLR